MIPDSPRRARRYLIVGCGGSGKSTLAKRIAEVERLPFVDVDALYWKEGWSLRTDAQVLDDLPLADAAWVLDGNFVDAVDRVWNAADLVIWLNYSKAVIFFSLLSRNIRWWPAGRLGTGCACLSGWRFPGSDTLPGNIRAFKRRSRIILEVCPMAKG